MIAICGGLSEVVCDAARSCAVNAVCALENRSKQKLNCGGFHAPYFKISSLTKPPKIRLGRSATRSHFSSSTNKLEIYPGVDNFKR